MNPRAAQFERYWRQRIADEVFHLLARSWDGDLHGMTYSDGIRDAIEAVRGWHEADDREVEAAQEEGRHEVGLEEAQGQGPGQPVPDGLRPGPDYFRGRADAADDILQYAADSHQHVGIYCDRSRGDRCDITAALRVVADIAREPRRRTT